MNWKRWALLIAVPIVLYVGWQLYRYYFWSVCTLPSGAPC
ncbi:tetratricopeptide repeat protein [Erythrobacter sp. HKB08]|nr:tetratricopeptide repeat protein [Erythrobacter sp. HKB08]